MTSSVVLPSLSSTWAHDGSLPRNDYSTAFPPSSRAVISGSVIDRIRAILVFIADYEIPQARQRSAAETSFTFNECFVLLRRILHTSPGHTRLSKAIPGGTCESLQSVSSRLLTIFRTRLVISNIFIATIFPYFSLL